MFWQMLLALGVGITLCNYAAFPTTLTIPFFKTLRPDLGWIYVPFAMLVIVGASNAVNLTDGLDGLAIGPVIIAAGTYLLFAYLAGHANLASYRITSYNVCYTKLLRPSERPGSRSSERAGVMVRATTSDAKIART